MMIFMMNAQGVYGKFQTRYRVISTKSRYRTESRDQRPQLHQLGVITHVRAALRSSLTRARGSLLLPHTCARLYTPPSVGKRARDQNEEIPLVTHPPVDSIFVI